MRDGHPNLVNLLLDHPTAHEDHNSDEEITYKPSWLINDFSKIGGIPHKLSWLTIAYRNGGSVLRSRGKWWWWWIDSQDWRRRSAGYRVDQTGQAFTYPLCLG